MDQMVLRSDKVCKERVNGSTRLEPNCRRTRSTGIEQQLAGSAPSLPWANKFAFLNESQLASWTPKQAGGEGPIFAPR